MKPLFLLFAFCLFTQCKTTQKIAPDTSNYANKEETSYYVFTNSVTSSVTYFKEIVVKYHSTKKISDLKVSSFPIEKDKDSILLIREFSDWKKAKAHANLLNKNKELKKGTEFFPVSKTNYLTMIKEQTTKGYKHYFLGL